MQVANNLEGCQVGLCASCICVHTQSHMNDRSSPEYQNIRNTYKNLNDCVTFQVRNMEDIKARISEVENKCQEKKDKLKQIITFCREEAHRTIDNFYVKKEEELLKQIDAQDKKNQLHCKYRLTALKNQITKEVSEVIRASQEIDECNFLYELPRLKNQTLHNAEQICKQIKQQIHINQCYITSIFYNNQMLPQMQNVLNQSIGMTIKIDLNANLNENKQKKTERVPHKNQVCGENNFVGNLNHNPEFRLKRPSSQTTIKAAPRNQNRVNKLFTNDDGYGLSMQRQNSNRVHMPKMNGMNNYALQKPINRLSLEENPNKQNFLKQKSIDSGRQNKFPTSYNRGDFSNDAIESSVASSNPFSNAPKENLRPNKVSISRISQKLIPYLNKNIKEDPWKTAQFKQIDDHNVLKKQSFDKKGNKSDIDLLTSFDHSIQTHRFDMQME